MNILIKPLSFTVAGLIFSLCAIQPVRAITEGERELRFHIEKMKKVVLERGTGGNARVEVKLNDGSRLKGYINEYSEEGIVLIDSQSEQAISITYREIKQIKSLRNTKPFKIGAAIAGGAFCVYWLKMATSD